MLKFIARHSMILMPLFCLLGYGFPQLANAVMPYLPQILFFLMFFTLLGLDQISLIKKLTEPKIWGFAVFQSMLMCAVLTGLAFLFGVRGDWLLAIAGIAATAPLFGSGAIVNAMGFDALVAMAKTIAATLLMPVTLLVVLWLLARQGASVDLVVYTQRLLIYIIAPMILAVVVRRYLPSDVLTRWYPKIAQFNVILLLSFPLGLVGSFGQLLRQNPSQGWLMFAVAMALGAIFYGLAFLLYRKMGYEHAVIAGVISGGRNVLLTYTIAGAFLGSVFLPLLGAFQLPGFSMGLIGKIMLNKNRMNRKRHTDAKF